MTPDEADRIIRPLFGYFGITASKDRLDAWRDMMTDLDAGRAGTTYARFKVEHHGKNPTPAQFMQLYRTVDTSEPTIERNCPHCDNTGYVTDTDHPRHWTGRPADRPQHTDPCDCNVATWCPHCHHGTAARTALRKYNQTRTVYQPTTHQDF